MDAKHKPQPSKARRSGSKGAPTDSSSPGVSQIIKNKTLYKPFYKADVTPYNKKYSVYVSKETPQRIKNSRSGKAPTDYASPGVSKPKLIHFGAYGYEQFKDKLGKYKAYDHGDNIRRANYRARHKKAGDLNNKNTAAYWAYNILW